MRLLLLAPLAAAIGGADARAQSLWSLTSRPLTTQPLTTPARPGLPASVAAPAARPQPAALLAAMPRPAMTVAGDSPGLACRHAIRAAEQAAQIPDQLMAAIGRVESGRQEADGSINPWPWSINAEGTDHVFETKAAAIAAVRALQQQGVRSIDVGCMQINLLQHPDAFASLDDAFDPVINARYAARFLLQLRDQTGAWPVATAWYHSATPELGEEYRRKVMAVWPEEQKHKQDNTKQEMAAAWAATRPNAPAALPMTMVSRATVAHIIPQASGTIGRGLAAYRALPIQLSRRPLLGPALTAPAPAAEATAAPG